MTRRLQPVRGCLLDIEGVLVRNKSYEPVPGAVEWVAERTRGGMPVCLVSNNTTDAPGDLVERLNAAGFSFSEDQLVGALDLGRKYLLERGLKKICWLGNPGLAPYWERAGFTLSGSGDCQAVVLGVNPELTVDDLDRALPAVLDRGVDLVCLHRNLFYLDQEDRRRLGPGCWSAALAALGGAGRVVTVGKPDPRIYREALKRIGVAAEDALFISDDPVADLVTAGRLGMQTVFVLSGKHGDHEVLGRMDQDDWPHVICASLVDVTLVQEDAS